MKKKPEKFTNEEMSRLSQDKEIWFLCKFNDSYYFITQNIYLDVHYEDNKVDYYYWVGGNDCSVTHYRRGFTDNPKDPEWIPIKQKYS